ncbi:MAG: polysaccharide deacetylase family protein [Gemmatimonadota bacterium]
MPNRIVVFTGRLDYPLRKAIVEIDAVVPDVSWLVLIHAPTRSVRKLARSQWRNLKRNGWRWIPYQARNVLARIAERLRRPDDDVAPEHPGALYGPEPFLARGNLDVERVASVHAPSSLERVTAFAPDLGISWGGPILKPELFTIPRAGTVNLHQGKVPDYRGMPPAFWELWNDEDRVGCTVHRVDAALDTGDIVAQGTLERERFASLRGMQLRLDELGIRLMRDAVRDTLAGRTRATPQPPGGRTYRKPTLVQAAELQRRLPRRRPPAASPIRQLGKDIGARTLSTLWRAGMARAFPPRVTVLLFHRVSDDARDDLTVGVEQFDHQMGLLRRHCRILSIPELLALSRPPRSRRPLVAVTFDDGYLDNFTNAAPILLRHAIPAAFFVATGIIGTDRQFPHDVRRGNPFIPIMEWDHVRTLRDAGFTIGSHTVSHIDCAAEPADVVDAELRQSLTDLRRELGLRDVVFAYPYGGRQHMTADRLRIVRDAGYTACLSAYGGANTGAFDRFDIRRRGIHWEYSDPAFLFRCLGLGST